LKQGKEDLPFSDSATEVSIIQHMRMHTLEKKVSIIDGPHEKTILLYCDQWPTSVVFSEVIFAFALANEQN
jgi:hypothetical protein